MIALAAVPGGRVPSPPPTRAGASALATVRLVAATAPEFDYEIPGLGDPVFTAGPGGPITAVYQVGTPEKSMSLRTGRADPGDTPGQRAVKVDGHPGRILSIPGQDVDSVELTWEYAAGVWLTIGTNGRPATEDEVIRMATTVRAKRQSLGFEATLGLIPEGWTLAGFKGSALLSYADPAHLDQQVHLQWWSTPAGDETGETSGLAETTPVTINGSPATLDRAAEIWVVNGGRLPDGSAFRLMAPRSFTADQVLRLARSVRRTE
ncbi:hypothetical protein L3i22_011240 [Actinoplanes sp. L3-i22]|nr:hypothetical protein L3i22_011240 [Actinoplanes sp. L3-i22]